MQETDGISVVNEPTLAGQRASTLKTSTGYKVTSTGQEKYDNDTADKEQGKGHDSRDIKLKQVGFQPNRTTRSS